MLENGLTQLYKNIFRSSIGDTLGPMTSRGQIQEGEPHGVMVAQSKTAATVTSLWRVWLHLRG